MKEFTTFIASVPVDFTKVYEIVNETVAAQEENTNYVPVGHVAASSQDNNFTFELQHRMQDVVVYAYIFDQYLLEHERYVFSFAAKYNWSDLSAVGSLNYSFEPQDQRCYAGDVCHIDINPYNTPGLYFEEFTELFDISPDGKIEFIPTSEDIGNHSLFFRVSNDEGAEEFVSFLLEVDSLYRTPILNETSLQIAVVGEPFHYAIEVEKQESPLVFTDDAELFNIDANGTIAFTPTVEMVGIYSVGITASVTEGINSTVWLPLIITDKDRAEAEHEQQELLALAEQEEDGLIEPFEREEEAEVVNYSFFDKPFELDGE